VASAQPLTLEFLDPRGAVVKSITSADRNGPAATPGMHRYAWDMRYADATGIEGGTFLAGGNLRGPVAVPGTYQVRLKAGGQTLTQPLKIVADPKSQATLADLQKQFDLLIAIRDKVSAVHNAVNDIRRLKAALGGKNEQARASLDAIEKELAELRFAGFDDQMLVFDLKLNNRIAALQNYVAAGDYPPTDQQQAVFKELSTEIDAALGRYTAAKAQVPSSR